MGMDHIQLKQEDILDGQPVLSDINPATNTKSVDNPNTGETLDETIARMWSVINNKLTRIVNSVNGRTGVVVLTAEDVGLGNVDNVSYAEIKQWIRDTIEEEFMNRALKLYESLADVHAVCATDDRSYTGAPFYCDAISAVDKRAAIGYYYWDSSTNHLTEAHKAVNIIGGTDHSIHYENGVISVKIHPDERALYLEEGTSESDSGLRIDESKLRGNMYFLDCLYGTGAQESSSDDTSLLALNSSYRGEEVEIYINDEPSNDNGNLTNYINTEWDGKLVKGDMIVTNFKYRTVSSVLVSYVDTGLMGQQPAIGVVTKVPDEETYSTKYEIKFYTINPFIGTKRGFGLCYYNTHTSDPNNAASSGQLGIYSLHAHRTFSTTGINENFSGIDTFYCDNPNAGDPMVTPLLPTFYFFTPWGPESKDSSNINGVMISTDTSLATFTAVPVSPRGDKYYDADTNKTYYFGSSRVRNWVSPRELTGLATDRPQSAEYEFAKQTPENGFGSNRSGLTLNLNKMVTVLDKSIAYEKWTYLFSDISGLRLSTPSPETYGGQAHSDTMIDPAKLGMTDDRDTDGVELTELERTHSWESGGISINIGKYLEIRPRHTEKALDYDQGGKVQVRIGPGIEEDIWYDVVDPWSEQFVFDKNAEYCMEYHDGAEDWAPIPYTTSEQFVLSDTEPANWTTTYTEYYIDTQTDPEGDPIFEPVSRVYDDNIPAWEADTYYSLNYDGMYMALRNLAIAGYRIAIKCTSNRFRIKVDHATTEIDPETGALTVVGGVGGQNIRYVDYRGCYFDTVPNRPVDDIVVLGAGLKVTGGTIPLDMNLGITKKKTYVYDVLATSGMGTILRYYIDHPAGGTAPSTATFQNVDDTRTNIKLTLDGTSTKETVDDIGTELYNESDDVKDLIIESEVRMYMTEHEADLQIRVSELFTSIDENPSEKATWFANIMTFFDITPPEAGTDVCTYLKTVIPNMKVYDKNKGDWKYMLDWLFAEQFKNE